MSKTVEQITLADLPAGSLFKYKGTLALKSEYLTKDGAIEAHIVGSGEMFWGGTHTAEAQRALIVEPYSLPSSPDVAGSDAVALEDTKPLRLKDFPNLVQKEKDCRRMIFGSTLYWQWRAEFLEKSIDPTYSDFERANCKYFHSILVNKQR